TEGDNAAGASEPRIKKFIPTPRKIGTGFVTKPSLDKPARKPFGASPSPRERRPFTRESNRPDRPSFTKPWAEEKADRLAAVKGPADAANAGSEQSQESPRSFERKPSFGREGNDRGAKRFGAKPSFGSRPSF